jgi:hypothetical protein
MSCPAPERELVSFLAAGTLSAAEREAVAAHAAGCPECTQELRGARELVEGLAAQHLTADEVVEAAWGRPGTPHLDECPRCRSEVDTVRAVNAELAAPATRAATRPAATWLGWAAALLLALPAALYFKSRPTPEGPATRGGGPAAAGLAISSVLTPSAEAVTPVPRRGVLLELPVPDLAPGARVEARLLDPGGRERMREADLPVQQGRARIALDASSFDAGTWRLELRLVGGDETARAAVSYALAVAAP